jgi:hypothetical protein
MPLGTPRELLREPPEQRNNGRELEYFRRPPHPPLGAPPPQPRAAQTAASE